MTHSEATASNAVARYLLGELGDPERDAFEEHYFDCSACAADVRAGATLFASGREVALADSAFRRFRPARWLASGAAAAALVVVAGYQTLVLPRMEPGPMPLLEPVQQGESFPVGEARSEQDAKIIHFDGTTPVTISVDVDRPFPRYRIELRGAGGNPLGTLETRAPEGSPAFLLRPLPAGRYVLTILGVREDGNRPEVVRTVSVVVQ